LASFGSRMIGCLSFCDFEIAPVSFLRFNIGRSHFTHDLKSLNNCRGARLLAPSPESSTSKIGSEFGFAAAGKVIVSAKYRFASATYSPCLGFARADTAIYLKPVSVRAPSFLMDCS